MYYVKRTTKERDVIVHITPDFIAAYTRQMENARQYPGKRIVITDGRGQQVGLPLVIQEAE